MSHVRPNQNDTEVETSHRLHPLADRQGGEARACFALTVIQVGAATIPHNRIHLVAAQNRENEIITHILREELTGSLFLNVPSPGILRTL